MDTEIYQKILNEVPHKNKYLVTEYDILDYVLILKEENERLKENNQAMQEEITKTWEIADDYKSRIDKAIEYIKINKRKEYRNGRINEFYLELNENKMKELLNILNGGDENDN